MDSSNTNPGNAFLGRHAKALEALDGIPVRIARDDVPPDDLSTRSPGATAWQVERPVGLPDRLTAVLPGSAETGVLDPAAQVERLSQLMLRETSLVRQHGPDSMAVVLRPDANTELLVHFTLERNGQVQATVSCERGDFHQLNALWPQLQESLAQQKVSMAVLQGSSANANANAKSESDASPSSFSPGPGSAGFGQPQNAPHRRGAPQDQSLAERSVPASTASASTRGERGSRPTLTTSRPGWETWA